MVEVILATLIIGAIIAAGWYAWKLNVGKQTSEAPAVQVPVAELPSGWLLYLNIAREVSFGYPKAWAWDAATDQVTSAKTHLGDLTSPDKATTVGVVLVRKSDGLPIYSTLDAWKAYAAKANINYSNLVDVKSSYTAFSYTLNVAGATSLVYEVLSPTANVEFVVLPTDTTAKATVEQIVATIRLEP